MRNDVLIVIPARIQSERLPRKVLEKIHGKPMIYWVVQRVINAGIAPVIVATDSDEVMAACTGYGFECLKTAIDHENGTERVFEVADKYKNIKYFLNVQGDEPLINTKVVEELVGTIGSRDDAFKTSISSIDSALENNPSEIKVALGDDNTIYYASRSKIPFSRSKEEVARYYKIHGVYLYHRSILKRFVENKPGILERLEKVEQLRCIESGIPLVGIETPHTERSVDTQVDLDYMRNTPQKIFMEA